MKRRRNINSWRLGICRFNVVWNATIDWISVSADIALKILGWLTVYNGRIRLSHKNFGGGAAHTIGLLAATLCGSRPGVQSASLIMTTRKL